MSISIEVNPEALERLEQAAAARGLSVELYVEDLIEQYFSQPDKISGIGTEEIDHLLDSLAKGSEDRPTSPAETYMRESIYHNHN
jgi:hypothetical protein